jgi:hypothetical protein
VMNPPGSPAVPRRRACPSASPRPPRSRRSVSRACGSSMRVTDRRAVTLPMRSFTRRGAFRL